MLVRLLAGATIAAVAALPAAANEPRTAGCVVYGATPGGIAAAVHAARLGVPTVLVQEDAHLGGLATGGLSNTDFRSFESLGGTFREFMQRVEAHYAARYGTDAQQVIDCVAGGYYEPRVARLVFEQMLDDAGVEVLLQHRLKIARVDRSGMRPCVRSIVCTDLTGGKGVELELQARAFVDGTYEGDLIAACGAEYRLGCESSAAYGESLAPAEANGYVQTYNFRICVTEVAAQQVPLPRPTSYDATRYLPVLEDLRTGSVDALTQETGAHPLLKLRRMPGGKAELNDVWDATVSLSVENINHRWPEGTPEVRQAIFAQYREHSLGLLWFLRHDMRVPAAWRSELARWGLPRDEYVDTGHWTPALYVREGRRLLGVDVFTEHDTQPDAASGRAPLVRDAIAIGDYSLNCHGVFSPGPGLPSIGHFGKSVVPYQVGYGVLVPRELDGLLAPVPMSASHVGYCALRMEPTWTALGQAAGVAVGLAARQGCELRDVDVVSLQRQLHALGAMTVYVSDLAPGIDVPRPAWDRPGTTFRAHLASVPPRDELFAAVQWLGTRGYLHALGELNLPRDRADGTDRLTTATGQWRTAFAAHALRPELAAEFELAERWCELATTDGVRLPAELRIQVAMKRLTRGELALAIDRAYRAVGRGRLGPEASVN